MRLVIHTDGGIITEVFSDEEVEVVVLDSDVEGYDEEDLTLIDDDLVCAYKEEVTVDSDYVNEIFKQVDEQ